MTSRKLTFEEFDMLKMEPFAHRLLEFMETEHRFVDGSLVVSLEAPFGSGKSTFLTMLANHLDASSGLDGAFALVVRLNAWESDIGSDPVLAIVSDITDAISATKAKVKPAVVEKLKSAAGIAGRMLTSVAGDFVTEKLGVDIVKAGDYAQGKVPVADETGLAVFKAFQGRKKALDDLKVAVGSLTKGSNARVMLLVDELDRCRPSYGIDYLEALKHLFNDPKFTVLLGIDGEQMASSAKALFGNDLKFGEYFRKFVHRRVPLPALSSSNSSAFCQNLVSRYFDHENSERKSFASFNRDRLKNTSELFLAFELSARQAHEAMRISSHCMQSSENQQGQMLWGWHVATMFMVVLSICRREAYHSIGRGTMPVAQFSELATSVARNSKSAYWWKFLLLAGYIGADTQPELTKLRTDAGIGIEDQAANDKLDQLAHEGYERYGWDSATPIAEIYSTIESLDRFAKDD